MFRAGQWLLRNGLTAGPPTRPSRSAWPVTARSWAGGRARGSASVWSAGPVAAAAHADGWPAGRSSFRYGRPGEVARGRDWDGDGTAHRHRGRARAARVAAARPLVGRPAATVFTFGRRRTGPWPATGTATAPDRSRDAFDGTTRSVCGQGPGQLGRRAARRRPLVTLPAAVQRVRGVGWGCSRRAVASRRIGVMSPCHVSCQGHLACSSTRRPSPPTAAGWGATSTV